MTASDKKIEFVIENRLYDVTKFAKSHPGGSLILENFHNCDVTDYFYALHSEQARKMVKNMPSTEVPDKDKLPHSTYLDLTYKLEKTDVFKANYYIEGLQIFHTLGFLFLAYWWGESSPLLAAVCLGFGTLLGGWIGHQADHQRNNIMRAINLFYVPICDGLSPSWWSEKHNRHHLSTNEVDYDGDIQLFPFIYLWVPKKHEDSWNRAIQHIYFSALYSILQIKWQYDSLIYAVNKRIYKELFGLAIHWIWYIFFLPWKVWVLGVLIAGTISAWVVTASHNAETKLEGKRGMIGETPKSKYQIHDYFAHQIITTRNTLIFSWFLNYISGGMQYQIEHHIFPRIPLYKLPQVKPLVEKLCKEKGLEYMEESFWEITQRNVLNIIEHAKVKV